MMSSLKKSISVFLTLVILFLTIFGCTSCNTTPPVVIRIGLINNSAVLPHAVILEQGYDKKYNFMLEETAFTAGNAVVDALANGTLDVGIAIGSTSMLYAAQKGISPDKVLSCATISFSDYEHPFVGVLVSQSIKNWQDLEGKTIAVNGINSVLGASIKVRLKFEGIVDYQLVEIAVVNMGLALADGTIDAAVISEPSLTQSILREDGILLDYLYGRPPLEDFEAAELYMNSVFYQDETNAKAYINAYLDALEWIDKHPTEARDVLGNRMSLTNDVTANMIMPRYSVDGLHDTQLIEDLQNTLISTGIQSELIPDTQLYDETLLNEVLNERK